MGRTPIPMVPPAHDPEQMLRAAYIDGRITLDQFEEAIGEAIEGGWTKTLPLVWPEFVGAPFALLSRVNGG